MTNFVVESYIWLAVVLVMVIARLYALANINAIDPHLICEQYFEDIALPLAQEAADRRLVVSIVPMLDQSEVTDRSQNALFDSTTSNQKCCGLQN